MEDVNGHPLGCRTEHQSLWRGRIEELDPPDGIGSLKNMNFVGLKFFNWIAQSYLFS